MIEGKIFTKFDSWLILFNAITATMTMGLLSDIWIYLIGSFRVGVRSWGVDA